LVLPGLMIIASLMFDMLQYCLGSVIWHWFYRSKEKIGVKEDKELQHGVWWERPIWIVFWLKIILMLVAYAFLFQFFFASISFR
jgi:hypothetical protein